MNMIIVAILALRFLIKLRFPANTTILTQKNVNQYGFRSIHYHESKCWNDICEDIKQLPSVNIYCQRLKAYLFENKSLDRR